MSYRRDEHIRILLTEDDTLIDDGLRADLSKMGFSIDWLTEGYRGKEVLYSAPYDAVILDLTLPGIDGRDILHEWRANGEQEPMLILTARDALTERVEGLRLGVNDYLCRPFALIGAAIRLKALVRRASGQASNTLCHGQITLDPGVLVATVAGEPLSLRPKEFTLLKLLMHNKGRVLPRKLIEERLYTWDENIFSNAAEVHVHRLHRKLGSDFICIVCDVDYTLNDA